MHQFIHPVAMVPVYESVIAGSVQSGDEIEQTPYTPDLLLNVDLAAWITDSFDFPRTCRYGFDAYFDEVVLLFDASASSPLVCRCEWSIVVDVVVSTLFRQDCAFAPESLGSRVGYVLGWLSALALTQSDDASKGIELLRQLVMSTTEKGV